MADDGVRLVKPGMKYEGAQGVTYEAGVSRNTCLLYTSPSPRDQELSRMPSSA